MMKEKYAVPQDMELSNCNLDDESDHIFVLRRNWHITVMKARFMRINSFLGIVVTIGQNIVVDSYSGEF